VINTDTWASMGQEEEAEERTRAFAGYWWTTSSFSRATDRAIFLHCLPAYRGKEVTEEVMEGRWSRIFDEAENRLHAQKAIMATLMGGRG
jgi:ornithine carbamoyltransferase